MRPIECAESSRGKMEGPEADAIEMKSMSGLTEERGSVSPCSYNRETQELRRGVGRKKEGLDNRTGKIWTL